MENNKQSVWHLLVLGLQHVFAMFGATVLVPALTGLDPSVALVTAGAGTLLFHLVTKRRVPVFLGSSFAFISAITAVVKLYGIAYAGGGIIVAGALYLLLAALVKLFGPGRVRSFFPAVVTGPMIVVIGLSLAPVVIGSNIISDDAGGLAWQRWVVAAVVVLTMLIVSIFVKGFFRLTPILFGIVTGYIASFIIGLATPQSFAANMSGVSLFVLPPFTLPAFRYEAIVIIAPVALATFMEHIGDITTNGAVVGKNFYEDPGLHRTLIGDGLATMLAGFVGGPANTTYSENTGVLAMTRNYNPVTLRIAAAIAVLLGFIGPFGVFLRTIPAPVMGGVSMVLFGMIAAIGLRTMIEARLDFSKSRNLLIVSLMLVLGLGMGGGIPVGDFAISGLTVAAVVGVVLNKALPQNI